MSTYSDVLATFAIGSTRIRRTWFAPLQLVLVDMSTWTVDQPVPVGIVAETAFASFQIGSASVMK